MLVLGGHRFVGAQLFHEDFLMNLYFIDPISLFDYKKTCYGIYRQ